MTKPGDGKDNDCDGVVDEEAKDGKDNDGDGFVDEDVQLVILRIIEVLVSFKGALVILYSLLMQLVCLYGTKSVTQCCNFVIVVHADNLRARRWY